MAWCIANKHRRRENKETQQTRERERERSGRVHEREQTKKERGIQTPVT